MKYSIVRIFATTWFKETIENLYFTQLSLEINSLLASHFEYLNQIYSANHQFVFGKDEDHCGSFNGHGFLSTLLTRNWALFSLCLCLWLISTTEQGRLNTGLSSQVWWKRAIQALPQGSLGTCSGGSQSPYKKANHFKTKELKRPHTGVLASTASHLSKPSRTFNPIKPSGNSGLDHICLQLHEESQERTAPLGPSWVHDPQNDEQNKSCCFIHSVSDLCVMRQ